MSAGIVDVNDLDASCSFGLTAGLMIVATVLMFDVVRSRNVLARQEVREGDLDGVILLPAKIGENRCTGIRA